MLLLPFRPHQQLPPLLQMAGGLPICRSRFWLLRHLWACSLVAARWYVSPRSVVLILTFESESDAAAGHVRADVWLDRLLDPSCLPRSRVWIWLVDYMLVLPQVLRLLPVFLLVVAVLVIT